MLGGLLCPIHRIHRLSVASFHFLITTTNTIIIITTTNTIIIITTTKSSSIIITTIIATTTTSIISNVIVTITKTKTSCGDAKEELDSVCNDGDGDACDVYDADICSAVSTMERNLLNPDSCSSNNPLSDNWAIFPYWLTHENDDDGDYDCNIMCFVFKYFVALSYAVYMSQLDGIIFDFFKVWLEKEFVAYCGLCLNVEWIVFKC